MPETLIPFTANFPDDLNSHIFSYLSFDEHNILVEESHPKDEIKLLSEKFLKKKYRSYVNVSEALANSQYHLLINNLYQILKNIDFRLPKIKLKRNQKKKYKTICRLSKNSLAAIIDLDFYNSKVNAPFNHPFVRDCIFHLCQASPQYAGLVLNKNIWRFWKSALSRWLIDYGALTNVELNYLNNSTFTQAVLWNLSLPIILKLIQKGAHYDDDIRDSNHNQYDLLLIAALQNNYKLFALLAFHFRDKFASSNALLDNMLVRYRQNKYSRTFGNFTQNNSNINSKSFNYLELLQAKLHYLQVTVEHPVLTLQKNMDSIYEFFLKRLHHVKNIDECMCLSNDFTELKNSFLKNINHTTHDVFLAEKIQKKICFYILNPQRINTQSPKIIFDTPLFTTFNVTPRFKHALHCFFALKHKKQNLNNEFQSKLSDLKFFKSSGRRIYFSNSLTPRISSIF